jgi:tetratricopeptide (TPR) repeat protein
MEDQKIASEGGGLPPVEGQAQLRCREGLTHHQRGMLAEAEASYRNCLVLDPNNFDACHLLGVINIQRKRPSEALKLLDRAVAINSQYANAHINRGIVLCDLKQFEEAVVSFNKVTELKPNHAKAYIYCGNALEHRMLI